jgi:hypothetical protein
MGSDPVAPFDPGKPNIAPALVPNTHEVASKVNPQTRVAYVDNDRVVLAQARALLAAAGRVEAVAGDLREPDEVMASVRQAGTIDLDQPVCVILGMILHFFDPAEAERVTAAGR